MTRLDAQRDRYVKLTSESEWALARQCARIMAQNLEMYSVWSSDLTQTTLVRDRSMAENINWILQREGPEARMVVWAHNTQVGKNENGIWKVLTTIASPFMRSPDRGARSLVWLALSEDGGRLDGEYIEDEKVVEPSRAAQDDGLARALWERSAELVGLSADAPA